MKASSYILLLVMTVTLFSCKKNFLDRNPQSTVTEEEFFRTPTDLRTYTNGLYAMLPDNVNKLYSDIYSDNLAVYTGGSETDVLLRGGITPATVGGWSDWGRLRSVNFMLDNVWRTTGDESAIRNYIGIARFFRALFYFDKVKTYGDVPWYSHVIGGEDEAQLTKPKDPRTLVVDSIMKDLEYAAEHIYAGDDNTRLTRWAALTLLARVALHEGTYRQYHPELNLQSSAAAFLQRAVSASQEIMDDGPFSIYKTTGGAEDFRTLFSSSNLTGNPEVIFLRKNSRDNGVSNLVHNVLDWQWALSRSLADEFLMTNGTPFTSQPGYQTKTFTEVFENRDPRMAETIMPPGFAVIPGGAPYLIKPNFGGYLQVKFYPRDPGQRGGNDDSYTDLAVFRFAEVLLINAEAKAELGTITQGDVDNTINLLRDRVNMPDLNITAANANPDPVLSAAYPDVTGNNRGLILEIRRERRVELATEGFRYDDLYRWAAGSLLAEASQGIYVPALGALDVTGDGEYDIAILQAPGQEGPISGLPPEVRDALVKYYLDGNNFYLSEGNHGYIMFTRDVQQPRSFIEPKYYYRPIPLQQTLLNPNLTQPVGW